MRILPISLIALVLIASIGLGWLFDALYSQYGPEEDNADDEIYHLVSLTQSIALTLDSLDEKDKVLDAWETVEGYSLQVLPQKALPLPEELSTQLHSGAPLTLESDAGLTVYSYLPNSDEVLLLDAPTIKRENNSDTLRYWFTSLFYLLLIGLFLLWVFPLISRLLILRKAAREFGKGDMSQRVPVGGTSYIRDLEVEFNHMAQRISDLISDVKLLSSAVSHDLRTPLARIRMGLDTLSEEEDPEKRAKYEDRVNANIDEMVELIETLLSYARLDQAMLSLDKAPINLNSMISKLIQSKEPGEKDLIFSETGSNLVVNGDMTYLKVLFNNLIQNALQHSTKLVVVRVSSVDNQILIEVEDDGPGISSEVIEDLFKPFIRAKSNKYKGFGVGLAIAKRVVEWHRGTIQVINSTNTGGAKFQVLLPTANVN